MKKLLTHRAKSPEVKCQPVTFEGADGKPLQFLRTNTKVTP